MKKLPIITLLMTFFISAPILAHTQDAGNLIPRNALLGNPDKMSVALSHDGKYISYVAPKDGVLNIWIAPSDKPLESHPVTNDKGRGIRSYYWGYDNKHIFFTQDHNGDENDRLYSYDIETKQTKLWSPAKGVRAGIAGISERFPNDILIYMNNRDAKYFDVYHVNLLDGTKKLVFENNKYTNVIADDNLKIRFASLMNKDGETEYYKIEDGKQELFTTIPFEDEMNTAIIGFDKTGDVLYILDSRKRNTTALTTLDLKTGKSKILAENKKSDIGILTAHPTEKNIQVVTTEYEKVKYQVLDKAVKGDIQYLTALNRGNLIINSRTLDDKTWLVAYVSDNAPVKYYKYDRVNKHAEFLFTNRQALENYKLAEMHPVVIKARDGIDLVSYITYPTGIKDLKNLPMVLLVHGGPFGVRDSWEYDPEHQLLANRGYAVLSVNYRGSGGFGKNFINIAAKQFGLKMHDDLIDAVNWAIKKKIADPSKIAIMGGSYGGYAALAGLTLTPDVFACGVDIVGISDLVVHLQNLRPYLLPMKEYFKYRIGDVTTPEGIEALKKVSPINFIDNIKKPLFIAQGGHDPRVKQPQSELIVAAMHKHHIPVMYALYPDEGHGFAKPENRLSHYALTEQFLADILGGRAEPIGDAMNGANLILDGMKVHNAKEAAAAVQKAVGK